MPNVTRFLRASSMLFSIALASCVRQSSPAGASTAATPSPAAESASTNDVVGTPIVEVGAHLARITNITSDKAGRFLLTVADDRTARLWEAQSGRQLRVFRVPEGEAWLNAGAISPDGRRAAIATAYSGGPFPNPVYLFDVVTGSAQRLASLPGVPATVAFDSTGSAIAVGLWNDQGVRVIETNTGRVIAQHTDYEGVPQGIDFSRDNWMVTSSQDGWVRIYDPSQRLRARAKFPGIDYPFGVKFSPDGKSVGVVDFRTPTIVIARAETLEALFSPDSSDVDPKRSWSILAWPSSDLLCAAGGHYLGQAIALRCWSDGGRGAHRDSPIASNTVNALRALPNGSMAFAAASAQWGIVTSGGVRTLYQVGPALDFRDSWGWFAADDTGHRIAFHYPDGAAATFSVDENTIRPGGAEGLHVARTNSPTIHLSDWKFNPRPLLNGRPLWSDVNDECRSVVIASDDKTFVTGSKYGIRRYDERGTLLWFQSTVGAVWGVNLSADGAILVTASNDGIVRWYRVKDGSLLLSLFVHANKTDWAAWRPNAQFAASPAGAQMFGLLSRTDGQLPQFTSGAVLDNLYRPDAVAAALAP